MLPQTPPGRQWLLRSKAMRNRSVLATVVAAALLAGAKVALGIDRGAFGLYSAGADNFFDNVIATGPAAPI